MYQFSPCQTLCKPMDCSMPGLPVHHQFPEFTQLMSIELVMPSNHLILCHSLLLLPSILPRIRVFSNESVRISWPKYGSFSFSPCNEYSGLIFLRIDWALVSLLSKGPSRVFSNTAIQKHQLFSSQPSSWSNSHMTTSIHDHRKDDSFD